MPHTSHRKKAQRTKRAELLDENGWTRVTTTDSARRAPRPLSARDAIEEREAKYTTEYRMSAPYQDATLEKVEQRYRAIEKLWLVSESWKKLEDVLKRSIDREVLQGVDKCVVFGTGSYCGLIAGWIERFDVSLYQLAAFKAVVDTIEGLTGHRPPTFSQEPVHNDLDVQLLGRLGIDKIDTPHGFKTLTPNSMIYAPAAELDVELRALAANPAIAMVTGRLDFFWRNDRGEACTDRILVAVQDGDDAEPEDMVPIYKLGKDDERRTRNRDEIEESLSVLDEFKKDKDVYQLPDMDVKDQPFHSSCVYARRLAEEHADSTNDI